MLLMMGKGNIESLILEEHLSCVKFDGPDKERHKIGDEDDSSLA